MMQLFTLFSLLACAAWAQDETPESTTVMVYMVGSDLESGGGAASQDLREMMAGAPQEHINWIVLTGGAERWEMADVENGRIYQIEGSQKHTIGSYGDECDMGQPSTLQRFVKDVAKAFPAQHYVLILWDHGGGPQGGFGWDEVHQHMLSMADIQKALSKTNVHFSAIGYDACLMGSVEIATIMAPFCDVMIASEETEPASGWDYTTVVPAVNAGLAATPIELGKRICDGYKRREIINGNSEQITLSVFDLKQMPAFSQEFDAFSERLMEMDSVKVGAAAAKAFAFGGSQPGEPVLTLSFNQFVSRLPGDNSSMQAAIRKLVPYTVRGSSMPPEGSVAIYFPLNVTEDNADDFNTYLKVPGPSKYKEAISQYIKTLDETASDIELTSKVGEVDETGLETENDDNAIRERASYFASSSLRFWLTKPSASVASATLYVLDDFNPDKVLTEVPAVLEPAEEGDGCDSFLVPMNYVMTYLDPQLKKGGVPVYLSVDTADEDTINGEVPVIWNDRKASLIVSGNTDESTLTIDKVQIDSYDSDMWEDDEETTEDESDDLDVAGLFGDALDELFTEDDADTTEADTSSARADAKLTRGDSVVPLLVDLKEDGLYVEEEPTFPEHQVRNPFTMERKPLPAGKYTVVLVVTDLKGNIYQSEPVTLDLD